MRILRIPPLALTLGTLLVAAPSALGDDASIQLGAGDDFVVRDSGAVERLRVDGTSGGVVVGGPPNQGDVWYDNGSGFTRLTPGVSGQFLRTNGAGANPQWATPSSPPAPVPSNVIFQYLGQTGTSGIFGGEAVRSSLSDTDSTGSYRYLQTEANSAQTMLRGKFLKTSSVSTVTIHAYVWNSGTPTSAGNLVRVNVGGNIGVAGTSSIQTPTWATPVNINVSGLSNGTTYDITVTLETTIAGTSIAKMGALFLLGS